MKSLTVLSGSKIIYFKNGVCEGEAFLDINRGSYYPTISIHKSATVSANFGPQFKYPEILQQYNCNGVSYSQLNKFKGEIKPL